MVHIDVPYIDQTAAGAYTGCESVTAVMLLRFLGIDVNIFEFIDRYLDKEPLYEKDGILYGPDPHVAFAGDPKDPDAMGCYAPVIVRALSRILGDDYEVCNETGTTLSELCMRYIDRGIPVIVWATIDMKEMIEGPSWVIHDTNDSFMWRSNEHCLLLVGYDDSSYIFNDPWENNGIVHHDKTLAENRYASQYSQAIAVIQR